MIPSDPPGTAAAKASAARGMIRVATVGSTPIASRRRWRSGSCQRPDPALEFGQRQAGVLLEQPPGLGQPQAPADPVEQRAPRRSSSSRRVFDTAGCEIASASAAWPTLAQPRDLEEAAHVAIADAEHS